METLPHPEVEPEGERDVVKPVRRLDQFLVAAGVVKRRSQAQKLFREGFIRGEDAPLKPATPPREGMVFVVVRGPWSTRYRILSVTPPRVEMLGKHRDETLLPRRGLDELFARMEGPFLNCDERSGE